MSAFVLTDANVRIEDDGGTVRDLTKFVMSATLNYTGDLQEETSMGTDGTRARLSGLKDWSLELTMKQDFNPDTGMGPDEVLFDLVGGHKVLVQVTADGLPRAYNAGPPIVLANPRYYGNAVLQDYSPLSGGVGELSTTPANFMSSGPLTRDFSAFTT